MVMALVSICDFHIYQMDIKTTFSNGDLDEEIYLDQPKGYNIEEGNEYKIYKLNNSLYGLKQTPRR